MHSSGVLSINTSEKEIHTDSFIVLQTPASARFLHNQEAIESLSPLFPTDIH